jgi:hypothetical protein
MKLLTSLFIVTTLFCYAASAQDTLPNFSIKEIGKEKVLISWSNPFPNCVQLAVQRSFDSTRFFTTVYSAISPDLPQNGFAVSKMPAGIKVYYRIFYVLQGGAYFFSNAKSVGALSKPVLDTGSKETDVPKPIDSKKIIKIYNRDKPNDVLEMDYNHYKKFKDSIITKTKDSIYVISAEVIMLKPFIAKPVWKPSAYIFTNTKGIVSIHLPLAKQHKYKIIFFDDDGSELYVIKQVKEADLTLDYGNFLHAGWYNFELYEDDKLKEKNKFLLHKLF